MPRSPSDLLVASKSPSYTPPVTDVPTLVALYAAAERALDLERALQRQTPAAARAVMRALTDARAPERARLVQLLGRLDAPEALPVLLELTGDADPKASRVALVALGKRPGPEAEAALLAAMRTPRSPAHLRAAVDALGKIGSSSAAAAVAEVQGDDPELGRLAARARLRLKRTASRDLPSTIDLDAAPLAVTIVFRCRPGIEGLLAEELGAGHKVKGPGRVEGTLKSPLRALFRARTFLDFAFTQPVAGDDPALVAAALAGSRDLLGHFTRGAIRYRLDFAGGGHRRAFVQDVAARVAALAPALENDPTASTWEAEIGTGEILLIPRRLEDPRFAYRVRDLPAASHPTLAAALVRVAGVRKDDVVWDPFVGSATELIERSRLGPCRSLLGTDRDEAALAAARANLAAAGLRAKLHRGDALGPAPAGVTLIVTNPPMGRRVARPDLLRFVDRAAAALVPGGRFVWFSPVPRASAAAAAHAGLRATFAQTVEMGGFTAELQAFEKPTSPRRLPSTSAAPRSRA